MIPIVTAGGVAIGKKVAKKIFEELYPWLAEQAKKSDTPIDNWAVEILRWFFDLEEEKKGG